MNTAPSGLRRYEGRYLLDWGWQDGKDLSTYLDVRVEDDHLTARNESVSYPVAAGFLSADHPDVACEIGGVHALVAESDHTFAARGSRDRYRFVLDEDDVANGLIVIRDGASSKPGPRFVPLPDEIPGLRDQCEWLDLGHASLCMTARDTEALTGFYERLGFASNPRMPGVLRQGWTAIAFLGFQPQPCINFRGASIVATAFELAKRGYVLANGRLESRWVQGDGTGGLMVYDPDGHRMFFNSHPPERVDYEAWKAGALEPGAGSHYQARATMLAPVTLPLGDLVVCLDVTDLDSSIAFYRGMGFEMLEQTSSHAILFPRPAREHPFAFPVRLRQGNEPCYSFGFLCEDVDGVAAEVERRGVDLIHTADGPAFADPDGNRVTLLPRVKATR